MTGHGQAQHTQDGVTAWAEVRAVNNRYLKLTISHADRGADLEAKVKELVQKYIRRGSVHVNLDVQRDQSVAKVQLNVDLLRSLHKQLLEVDSDARVESLLGLPGILEDRRRPQQASDEPRDWTQIKQALDSALQQLVEMRKQEGASAAKDLLENASSIESHLRAIETQAPKVSAEYSKRLIERINNLLAEHNTDVTPADIAREVGIFAEKCDISEETVRLQTHVDQFRAIINSGQSDGRKLEFLSQEMLRETNTIGSKANDSLIAQNVVEVKTAIERIREMSANVE